MNTDGLGGRVLPNICCVEMMTLKMNELLQGELGEHRVLPGLTFLLSSGGFWMVLKGFSVKSVKTDLNQQLDANLLAQVLRLIFAVHMNQNRTL